MAFDAFIKIDGIEGESSDTRHSGWIEVIHYALGQTRNGVHFRIFVSASSREFDMRSAITASIERDSTNPGSHTVVSAPTGR